MKKLFLLLIGIACSFGTADAQTVTESVHNSYFERDLNISLFKSELGNIYFYTEVIAENSISAMIYFDAIDVKTLFNRLIQVRDKYAEWSETARKNGVTSFNKEIELGFPAFKAMWYDEDIDDYQYSDYQGIRFTFEVLEGKCFVHYINDVTSEDDPSASETIYWVFGSIDELNEVIDFIDPAKIDARINQSGQSNQSSQGNQSNNGNVSSSQSNTELPPNSAIFYNSYFDMDFDAVITKTIEGDILFFTEVYAETSEYAAIIFNDPQSLYRSLRALREKYAEWSAVARKNKITDFKKEFDVSFPDGAIMWQDGEEGNNKYSAYDEVNFTFQVFEDGSCVAHFIGEGVASEPSKTETIYWVFSSVEELDALIKFLDPSKIDEKVNKKERNIDDLFQ